MMITRIAEAIVPGEVVLGLREIRSIANQMALIEPKENAEGDLVCEIPQTTLGRLVFVLARIPTTHLLIDRTGMALFSLGTQHIGKCASCQEERFVRYITNNELENPFIKLCTDCARKLGALLISSECLHPDNKGTAL